MRSGELLIKEVYESLRASPLWDHSALFILYDEHGGIYDGEPPPKVEPPGDTPFYSDANKEREAATFRYDRLGVRVPAVIVEADEVAGAFGKTEKFLEEIFALSRHARWQLQDALRAAEDAGL